jgi:hypothetical protein
VRPYAVLIAACLTLVPASAGADGPVIGPSGALVDQLWSSTGSADVVVTKELTSTLVQARSGITRKLLWQTRVPGLWGAPQVTQYGDLGGLARGAHTLVLQQLPDGSASVRSRFAVIHAEGRRASTRYVDLAGTFAFDALSPDAGLLYLIQDVRSSSFSSYRVRVFDLGTGRLWHRVITERGEPASEPMHGVPTARATSRRGVWVFTLYVGAAKGAFVHALNARTASARCIDLPWSGAYPGYKVGAYLDKTGLTLVDDRGTRLAAIDLKTWRVSSTIDPTRVR